MWGLAATTDQEVPGEISIFKGIMINLEYLGAFILEISMYFFIFEMMKVRNILTSNNHIHYKKRNKEIKMYSFIATIT
jgi:hypothetical protein